MNNLRLTFPFYKPIIITLVLIVGFSCTKSPLEEEVNNENEVVNSITSVPANKSALRTGRQQIKVRNGLLEFRNLNEYHSFTQYLKHMDDNWVSEFEETEDTYVIPHEGLDAFEASINFVSFRKVMEKKKEESMRNGTFTDESYPDDFWIRDIYTRTVYNDQKEVKIGNSIFKLMNNKHIVEITDGSFNKLQRIREQGYLPISDINVFIHDLRTGEVIGAPGSTHKPIYISPVRGKERTEMPWCGNGHCEELLGETEYNCIDCRPAVCGNGICEVTKGEFIGNCPADCGFVCGNGVCERNKSENGFNCPDDCLTSCGNGICEWNKDEYYGNCPQDCVAECGNGYCEWSLGEDAIRCPDDCYGKKHGSECKTIQIGSITIENTDGCVAKNWNFEIIPVALDNNNDVFPYVTWKVKYDFGDGTVREKNSILNPNNAFSETHLYATSGEYTATITVEGYKDIYMTDLCGIDEEKRKVVVGTSTQCCDYTTHWTGEWFWYDSEHKIYFEVAQNNNFLTANFQGRTEHYEYRRGGLFGGYAWRETKAKQIYVEVGGSYYTDNCTVKEQVYCTNVNYKRKEAFCKDQNPEKGNFGSRRNEVTSYHYVIAKDDKKYEKRLWLDVSPPCTGCN